ncbi:hypothetical protein [Aerococcus urinaeequi]
MIGAIDSNPIAIIIPCHRIVIPSNQVGNQIVTNNLGQLLRGFERS